MGSVDPRYSVPADRREMFRSAFECELFVRRAQHFYPDEPVTVANAVRQYGSRPVLRRVSPNLLFDETWYRAANPDVESGIAGGRLYSGFHHFVFWGWRQGRFPNPMMGADQPSGTLPAVDPSRFETERYLAGNAAAQTFLRHFPFVSAYAYFDLYGRRLDQPAAAAGDELESALKAEFDADFYRAAYLEDEPPRIADRPFEHYFYVGRRLGHSPNRWFDEGWYLAFYADVRAAVQRRELLCGFHHYVVAGMREGRSPRYALERALEVTVPGVTRPDLIARAREIQQRIQPIPATVTAGAARTLWLLVPRLNPDIAFGGYRALFELTRALKRYGAARGIRLAVVTTEERHANQEYFSWRMRGQAGCDLLDGVVVRSRYEIDRLEIGPHDRFLAYSTWDALLASPLAARTDEPRILALVQEYEPLFSDHSSLYSLSASGLEVPSYPIFNSSILRDYFRRRRLGIFRDGASPVPERDYAVFEHVINRLPSQCEADIAGREERVLAFYARPETHASRNLYEIAELALRRLCQSGLFDRRWRFVGLGCLTALPAVELGGGHRLEFVKKMPEAEYIAFVKRLDIGLSLMYAPHPSLMPYEFATTGALVVTNTFENRSRRYFERTCANFVPCAPTIDGVADAIRQAHERVEDWPRRVAGAYRPPVRGWAETFDDPFMERTVGRVLR